MCYINAVHLLKCVLVTFSLCLKPLHGISRDLPCHGGNWTTTVTCLCNTKRKPYFLNRKSLQCTNRKYHRPILFLTCAQGALRNLSLLKRNTVLESFFFFLMSGLTDSFRRFRKKASRITESWCIYSFQRAGKACCLLQAVSSQIFDQLFCQWNGPQKSGMPPGTALGPVQYLHYTDSDGDMGQGKAKSKRRDRSNSSI